MGEFGDAEDWAAARVAELRAAGEDAMIGFVRTEVAFHPLGPFHGYGRIMPVVLRLDGSIERPPKERPSIARQFYDTWNDRSKG